jgi:predicted N-acetyltransferase YhbS
VFVGRRRIAVIATVPVETWDIRSLSLDEAEALGKFIAEVWPKPNVTALDRARQVYSLGRQFGPYDQTPLSFVVRQHDRVVAHAAMLPRRIRTETGELVIGGLSRVGSDPALRGQGLGELVVRTALGTVDRGIYPFALFQTNRRVQPFYEKLGAVVATNRVVNSRAKDPKAPAFWDEVVMRYPSEGGWPAGEIDLLGAGW